MKRDQALAEDVDLRAKTTAVLKFHFAEVEVDELRLHIAVETVKPPVGNVRLPIPQQAVLHLHGTEYLGLVKSVTHTIHESDFGVEALSHLHEPHSVVPVLGLIG